MSLGDGVQGTWPVEELSNRSKAGKGWMDRVRTALNTNRDDGEALKKLVEEGEHLRSSVKVCALPGRIKPARASSAHFTCPSRDFSRCFRFHPLAPAVNQLRPTAGG